MTKEKMEQIEKIEQELGIDLITLYKAIKDGFYSKQYDSFIKPEHTSMYLARLFDCKKMRIFILNTENEDFEIASNDYGKTWALTKEELE